MEDGVCQDGVELRLERPDLVRLQANGIRRECPLELLGCLGPATAGTKRALRDLNDPGPPSVGAMLGPLMDPPAFLKGRVVSTRVVLSGNVPAIEVRWSLGDKVPELRLRVPSLIGVVMLNRLI
jgi:hypothetical protein